MGGAWGPGGAALEGVQGDRGLGLLPNRAGHSVDSASHRLVCTTDATNISFTSTMTHEGMEAEGGNGMIEGEA